jgi:hypothetical protein
MVQICNNQIVAPCGLNCSECLVYKAKDNPKIVEALIAKGFKPEEVPCPGCRSIQGKCPVIKETCENYTCTVEHKVDFCFECSDFPCSKLNPASDMANQIPHNLKIFNLCYIKEKGLEKWLEVAPDITSKYFQGKMVIGKGPYIEK